MFKQDAVNLFNGLNSLGGMSGSPKFAYAVSKNLALLKPEIEAINKAGEVYEQKRMELARKYSKKNTFTGEAEVHNNQFQLDDVAGFNTALQALREEDDYKNYQELLNQPSDFFPYKIKLADLPTGINVQQMNAIINIVEE